MRNNELDLHCNLYSFIRPETRQNAMGLSSQGYNGTFFWDTELWMYPTLLVMQPEMAKSLGYRADRLTNQTKATIYGTTKEQCFHGNQMILVKKQHLLGH
jgi:hypothetical protein